MTKAATSAAAKAIIDIVEEELSTVFLNTEGDETIVIENGVAISVFTDGGFELVSGLAGHENIIVGSETSDQILLANSGGSTTIIGGEGDDVITNVATGVLGQHATFHGGIGMDTLSGSDSDLVTDHLFGGPDKDILLGRGGDDVLEGGTGDDVLNGGAGIDILKGGEDFDTYYSGDGDTIIDSDGEGKVYLNGILLNGETGNTENDQNDPDAAAVYTQSGTDLNVELNGSQITINNWNDGDLGITLGNNENHCRFGETLEYLSIGGLKITFELPSNQQSSMSEYEAQCQTIVAILQNAYSGSNTFKSIVNNAALVDDALTIVLGDSITGASYFRLDDTVRIELPLIDQRQDTFFDQYGREVKFSHDRLVIHEVIHDLANTLDLPVQVEIVDGAPDRSEINQYLSSADSDHQGPTVRLTNTVLNELGAPLQRISYDAQDTALENGQLSDFAYWTFGQQVEHVYLDSVSTSGTEFIGGNGSDLLISTGGSIDSLSGGSGVDFIYAGPGADFIDGGLNSDFIVGGYGEDYITGGGGNDVIYADEIDEEDNQINQFPPANEGPFVSLENDTVFGGGGDDVIFSDLGTDMLDGGAGNDVILSSADNATLLGGEGDVR